MFVTPLQVQELFNSHGKTMKKKHEVKNRLDDGETNGNEKISRPISKPKKTSGENEEPKMDLSKRQRIPVVQRKRLEGRRHEFFSDSPKNPDEHKTEKDKTTLHSRNPTKGA